MEEGKPEDVSLLAGGADRPLIPVQGGGFFNFLVKKNSAKGAAAIANVAVQSPTPESAFDVLWTSLDSTTKLQILKETGETVKAAKGDGISDSQITEMIPNSLIEKTLNAIDRKHGTESPDLVSVFKYATAEQIEAGKEEAYKMKAAGKGETEIIKAVSDKMDNLAKDKQMGRTFVPSFARKFFLSDVFQKTYRRHEKKIINRNEYMFNINKELDNIHPMIAFLNNLDLKYKDKTRFGRYITEYINLQTRMWNAIALTHNISIPHMPKATKDNEKYENISKDESRRVTCLDSSIQHIIIIPPLDKLNFSNDNKTTSEKLRIVLRDLYDLNIFTIDDSTGICKINKKVALIFTSVYDKEDEAIKLFLYISMLEINNEDNIFCLSNFSKGEIEAGLVLLNSLVNSPTNMCVPTLLSPSGIVYPYRMRNNVDGIFIGCNFNAECKEDNIFKTIYSSKGYGNRGYGLFVNKDISFVKCNRSILRYNYSIENKSTDFLNDIIFSGTNKDVIHDRQKSMTIDEFKTNILNFLYVIQNLNDFVKEIYLPLTNKMDYNIILQLLKDLSKEPDTGVKPHIIYTNRGQFIILMEIYIYIRNNIDKAVNFLFKGFNLEKKISVKNILNKRIKDVLYTRFPKEEDYNSYISFVESSKSNLEEIYKKNKYELPERPERCGQRNIKSREKGIGIFDLEQYSPYTICVFSIKKDDLHKYKDGTGDVCVENDNDFKGKYGDVFTEWSFSREIANVTKLQLIDLGSKSYSIREVTQDVKCNLSGYMSKVKYDVAPISGGGKNVSEYEKEYNKIVEEITTTLVGGKNISEYKDENNKIIGDITTTLHVNKFNLEGGSISTSTTTSTTMSTTTSTTMATAATATAAAATAAVGVAAAAVGLGALAYAARKKFNKINKVHPLININENTMPGGGPCSGEMQDTPILVKGEADLLNDLNLTPTNIQKIFHSGNIYGKEYKSLTSWRDALPRFFESLTIQKCYENRLLLTYSECEESKYFLYSIGDYLDKNETEIQEKTLEKDTKVLINEPDLMHDKDIQLSKMSIGEPQYYIDNNSAAVRVGAIEKSTNIRVHFVLRLKEKKEGDPIITANDKDELNNLFDKKKYEYRKKYVMYLY